MRPTIAEIDLSAIRHNMANIKASLPAGTDITAVVKANAYGHGAVAVSRAALEAGADCLAVAIPEEGAELRQAGFGVPIYLLGLILPQQASLVVEHNLTATICLPEHVSALAAAARSQGRRCRVMIKVDTGMNRIGLPPDQLTSFATAAAAQPELDLCGVFTHLASADAADKDFANRQLAVFTAALNDLEMYGIRLPVISAGNSAGIIDLPDSHFNAVRPGIILYGLSPSSDMHRCLDLRPAMRLVTKVVLLKKVPAGASVSYNCTWTSGRTTWLATLPIGYADGYHRSLSGQASVLIGGKRRPVAGRVCMDQIVVDIGPECDVAVGDEAVLFGRQGDEEITVTELAGLAGTIHYELLCSVSSRVPRVYR